MKTFIETQFTTDSDGTNVPDLGGYETDDDVQYSVYDRRQDGGTGCLCRVTAPEAKMTNILNAAATTEKTDQEVLDDDTVPFSENGPVTLENMDQPDIEVDQILDTYTVNDVLDTEEKLQLRVVLQFNRDLSRSERSAVLSTHNVESKEELADVLDQDQLQQLVDDYGISPIPDHITASTAARACVQIPSAGRQTLQDQEMTAMMKAAKAEGRPDASTMSKNTRADKSGQMNDNAANILRGRNDDHQKFLDYVKGNTASPPKPSDQPAHAKGSVVN